MEVFLNFIKLNIEVKKIIEITLDLSNTMIRKVFRTRINEILNKFGNSDFLLVSEAANFFGQLSKGLHQIRGNGVLILMKSVLYFEMWYPKKILEITIDSINQVDIGKSILGKSKFRELLIISFINSEGESDSAAWLVKNLNNWVSILRKSIIN